jgi:hypothetical protein
MIPISSKPACLNNFIGVKCLTTNPVSGLWINDLPGINLSYAADISDTTGLQLLNEKIDFATMLVLQELSGAMIPYFRQNSIIDQIQIGYFRNSYLAPAALNRGVHVKTKFSRLTRLRINTVKISIQQPLTPGVIVIDNGLTTESFAFTTDSTGNAEIFTNYLTNSTEAWILLDNTGINVNNSEIKSGCGCSSKATKYITASGWNGTSDSTSTYGLIVDAVAECSFDDFGCLLISKLPFLVLYRAGIEIIKEAITTDRLNSITLMDSEKAQFLLDDFNNEYQKHLKNLVNSLPELLKRVDECCIVCNQGKYTFGTP